MSTEASVTGRAADRLPPTGSRSWWLLYLLGPFVLLGLGLFAFPELVYDRYVWQYLWGPVVADAAGTPVAHQGVTAVKGYNPVNTLTYVAVAGYALPGVRAFFETFDVELDTALAYGLAPILVAGGVMRALEDAGRLPIPLDRLFVTPPIYFVVAAIAVLALLAGVLVRDRTDLPNAVPTVAAIGGSIWTLAAGAVALAFGLGPGAFRPLAPVAVLAIAGLVTGAFYAAGTALDRPTLRHPLALLLVFGQSVDAAQNLLGVGVYGYTPKLFITSQVYELTGFAGSTFLLKLGIVTLIVSYVATSEEDVTATWNWLVLFAATAVGLPQGVRGALRIALGV
ncbi:hypothetical protein BRC90_00910 [Halobacteriales archaeon QS_4_69_34]|nr:MAG: hypothetical protein BRC90_00910 [Halobacteriales archaeon QS_4_69_34]